LDLIFAFRTRGQDDSERQIHPTSTTIVGQPAVWQLAGVGTLPAQMVRYFSARPDSEAWTELATEKTRQGCKGALTTGGVS
jgi:hypothetical protein